MQWQGPWGMLVVAALAAAAFYLLTQHFGHVLGALPYLLFLACPLMHFFGHGKHKH